MSRGEIAYEASHAALREYRRTHHDQCDPAGRWPSVSPQFQAAWDAASQAVASVVVERLHDAKEEHPVRKRRDAIPSPVWPTGHVHPPHGRVRPVGATVARRAHALRMTDHEATPRTDDLPPARPLAPAPPDPSTEDGAAKHPSGASDTGERSSQAHEIHRGRAVAQAAPEVRRAKVEAARRALQEGSLLLDGPALADKLLQAVCAERRHA